MNEITKEVAKLGQTAEALWPHAVRYVAIDAVAAILMTISVVILSAVLVRIGSRRGKEYGWNSRDPEWVPYIVVGGTGLFLSFLTCVIEGHGVIARAIEPVGYLTMKVLGK